MNANPDRLRQILRQGDPAAHEPGLTPEGLTPEEVHAMRRTVLTAAPEPRRRIAWIPVLATGMAALLALALAVAFGPWHRAPAPALPPPVRMAAVPTPTVAMVAPSVPPAPAPTTVPLKIRPARHRRPARPPKALPIHRDDSQVLTASLPVREIQFSTPGGTRVIWELSGKDSR